MLDTFTVHLTVKGETAERASNVVFPKTRHAMPMLANASKVRHALRWIKQCTDTTSACELQCSGGTEIDDDIHDVVKPAIVMKKISDNDHSDQQAGSDGVENGSSS